MEGAGERGGEEDDSRGLLRPLVGMGRELVSRFSDGELLLSIGDGLLKVGWVFQLRTLVRSYMGCGAGH